MVSDKDKEGMEKVQDTGNGFCNWFTGILLIFGLILSLTMGGLYLLQAKAHLSQIKLEEKRNLEHQQRIVASGLGDVFSDLYCLSRQNELHQLLVSEKGREYRSLIAKEYLELVRQKRTYDQIRFLDHTGMEKVRVNFNGGNPGIVQGPGLQNKATRYYFKDTFVLGENEVFVSPLDLNMEKGKIEIPFKPMIRFGIPVVDSAGQKRGVILINYLGSELIKMIREAASVSSGDIMLVNSLGYWLMSPDPGDEWGFMISERQDLKFSSRYPEIWDRLITDDFLQIENTAGLFTAGTIAPIDRDRHSGSVSNLGSSGKGADAYYWKVISHIPAAELNAVPRAFLNTLLVLGGILFLAAAIPSWVIAKAIVRRRQHREQMQRYWNQLEMRVQQGTRELRQANYELTKLSRAVEQSPASVMILDLDWHVEYANPRFSMATGFDTKEIEGQHIRVLASDQDNSGGSWANLDTLVANREWRGELLTKKKNNEIFWEAVSVSPVFDDEGEVTHRLVINEDITERKRMEDELRRSEARFRTILDAINTGVVVINPENRTIVDANPVAEKLIGLPKDEIVGKHCHEFICPNKYHSCPIIDQGKRVDNAERVLVTADGRKIPILKTVVPVLLNGKKHLLESFVDISERKEVELKFQRNYEELEQFNRLTIRRELAMIKLKEEINTLLETSGRPARYKIVDDVDVN